MYLALTALAVQRLFAERHTNCHGAVALVGLLAGAAVSCKYPALLFVAAPALAAIFVWVLQTSADRPLGQRLKAMGLPLAIAAVAFIVACGGWFAKNVVHTGNPTYPLLSNVFPTKHWSEESQARWSRVHSPPRSHGDARATDPVLDSVTQVGWRSNWLNPILWPLCLLALLFARDRRTAVALAALVLAYFAAWWWVTHRVDRFWLPVLPLAAALAALGAVSARNGVLRVAVIVLLVGGLSVNLLGIVSRAIGDNRFLLALEHSRVDTPHPADSGYSRTHPAHRALNQWIQPDDLVLLVGDSRPFDIEGRTIYHTPFNASPFEAMLQAPSQGDRRRMLEASGATLVYVAWADIARERSSEGYGFSPLVTRRNVVERFVAPGLLAPLECGLHPELGELFRVVAK